MPELLRFFAAAIPSCFMLFGAACVVLWREEIVRARAANEKQTGTVFAVCAWDFFMGALLVVVR